MDHMQFLVERASEPDGEPCGHALMASCPPDPAWETQADIPYGHCISHSDGDASGPKTWDLSKGDLANLLDLSKRLHLNGEITPVMAWGMVLADPRFPEFKKEDFERICQDLLGKVRCYGYVYVSLVEMTLIGIASVPSWRTLRYGMP